ncbi:hypothetical protein [Alkalithermobacter paradoxus]|uniref:Uncharacterized protein n=1 Tax=Alkalithermobacter paradoxus TaxID=29349 RepID=A0A1V4I952_9FIRM|nr:hypothetical protein CLOTH_08640 [[Clostridium] thermoalcaliphilum]
MQRKYIVFAVSMMVLVSIVFITRQGQDRYYPEMSYDILNYEEAPQFLKDIINDQLILDRGDSTIKMGDGTYIILIPPKNHSVEVLSVEKNINSFNGIIYRYRYTDKVSDNILDNIKIIKVSNFSGSVTGSFTSR